MKKSPDIFKDQPLIGEGEDAVLASRTANAMVLKEWLRTGPPLNDLKKAALYEGENKRRVQILDLILIHVFRLERQEAMLKLMKQ